ncbi:fibronectin type 3 and ankyrin repeat domains protein 1-like isoform X2 [Ruditapes philippinarum]|uniref:fibronectin type 3 and ankyrin repeat domains protein 1-like isoform X2 n=1 Tax=Ruditapes philippinarum TaxID=129788 RepID=UPI00295C2C6C|nr:fibronectin type 3 and ankyrin repeat domains protein 1-like isoform X2 [Ruditapes philippinarum]
MFDITNNATRIITMYNEEDRLCRPPPPIVGKVTHHSIELYWDEAIEQAMAGAVKGEGRVRVCLQEHDRDGEWGNLYSGYAKRHTVSGLDPQSEYKYRMRMMNSAGNSDWSAHVKVSTTKEPMNGEHLHKALNRQDLEMLEKIIESGDVKIDVPDKYGFSPLMQASVKGYESCVELLLKHGADVNLRNDAGKTALMLACYAGQLECVKILRKYGAKYDDFDRGGSAPIHWAVDGGCVKLLDWMIEDGADVNLRDLNSLWTPLIRCASVSGHRDIGVSLLQNHADINAQDRDGKTALMLSILNGHQALLEVLLKKNADIKLKNEYGKTAYDMAVSIEKRRILRTLTDHMEAKGIKT